MLENLIELFNLKLRELTAIDLNDRCIVSMYLDEMIMCRDDDGLVRLVRADEVKPKKLSLMFQVTEDTEGDSAEYNAVYGYEVTNEEDFYQFMIEAKLNAKAYKNGDRINVELRSTGYEVTAG
jgi:hypothetical protein